MRTHRAADEHPRQTSAGASRRQPWRRCDHQISRRGTPGRIICRTGLVLGIALQPSISAAAALAWQPGRIHQLAKMKLIDLIALYQSMLQSRTEGHDQVVRAMPSGWTKDQIITVIRNLEAPYEEVGGWKRAMEIIGAESADGSAPPEFSGR